MPFRTNCTEQESWQSLSQSQHFPPFMEIVIHYHVLSVHYMEVNVRLTVKLNTLYDFKLCHTILHNHFKQPWRKRQHQEEIEYLIRLWLQLRSNLKYSKVKCKSPKAFICRFSCKAYPLRWGTFTTTQITVNLTLLKEHCIAYIHRARRNYSDKRCESIQGV